MCYRMALLGGALLCVLVATHIEITHEQGSSAGHDIVDCDDMRNEEATNVTLPGTDQCGKGGGFGIIPVVVGGSNAYLGMYPWMAALGYNYSDSVLSSNVSVVCSNSSVSEKYDVAWLCGGSLVSEKHVITAAHCLHNLLKVVRLGDLNLDDSIRDGASPRDYKVDSWLQHPNYRTLKNIYDIGIINLKIRVTFTRLIQPICLPILDELKTKNFTGYSAYIAGWGDTYYGGRQAAHLQEARIDIYNNTVCEKAYENKSQYVVNSKVVCAARKTTDTCQGDSGGPLMVRYGPGLNFYLYGVVSCGEGCADELYPGLYTRVSEFLTWLLPNLT